MYRTYLHKLKGTGILGEARRFLGCIVADRSDDCAVPWILAAAAGFSFNALFSAVPESESEGRSVRKTLKKSK